MRKRVLFLVLSVAALMVAMVVVSALPALAAPGSGGGQPSSSLTAMRVFMGVLLIGAGLPLRVVQFFEALQLGHGRVPQLRKGQSPNISCSSSSDSASMNNTT
jgi:hypothetical protein